MLENSIIYFTKEKDFLKFEFINRNNYENPSSYFNVEELRYNFLIKIKKL